MYFELSVIINRSPADTFAFLRDKDKYIQKPSSPVLILEQTTPGPPGIGTRYREVVQMLPFLRGEIISEITRYEPYEYLAEDFAGAGMKGHLAYQFLPHGDGTKLFQRETVHYDRWFKLAEPFIRPILGRQLQKRLQTIKVELESGYQVGNGE